MNARQIKFPIKSCPAIIIHLNTKLKTGQMFNQDTIENVDCFPKRPATVDQPTWINPSLSKIFCEV